VGAAGPLFALGAVRCQNARRQDEHLEIAEEAAAAGGKEQLKPGTSIDELAISPGRTGCPAGAQRFGNTKTFGVLRAEFTGGWPTFRRALRHGLVRRAADPIRPGGPFFFPGQARTHRRHRGLTASALSGSR